MKKENEKSFVGKWYLHSPMCNALLAGLLTSIAFGLAHLAIIPRVAEIVIYLAAILLGGYHWAWEGIEKIIEEKEIGIEILMMGATIGAAVLGMWDEAAFLVFLYGAAEGIEEYTYARTRHSIRKLLDLAPKQAILLQNGKEILIPAEQLEVGDIFLVKPGETIATDGVIIRGSSNINEAPVTGESMPVEKKEGMKVFAATFNQEGALEIRVTASFEDNTLSKIIHLVEEAQEQKEIRAKIFTPRLIERSFSFDHSLSSGMGFFRMGHESGRAASGCGSLCSGHVHTRRHRRRNWKGRQKRNPDQGRSPFGESRKATRGGL